MKTRKNFGQSNGENGSAVLTAVLVVVVLLTLCGAMLSMALRSKDERGTAVDQHQALFAARSGVAHALVQLADQDNPNRNQDIGTSDDRREFGGGTYWVDLQEDQLSGTFLVSSFAQVRGQEEAVEALLSPVGSDIYDHALFAGNVSDDPRYTMELGGSGGQADEVRGDTYSGGNVELTGDASVSGDIRAGGSIEGASGDEGVYQPIPDIAGMDYPNTADFNVASLFRRATYTSDDAGGRAWQVPESNPAHIFRRNPNDRTSNTHATVKDDYFLEDPYEPVRIDPQMNGTDAYPITLSGVSGEPGVNGNQKVYYIDGNLWIHNRSSFSFEIAHNDPNGVQITFVARGNIYFSDNLFYSNPTLDGVAFIAMTDSAVEDSGNIYFGDPVFGTLEQMHAFMYAENNFYDQNLDASGSQHVLVHGNMTAGNQVLIERDYGRSHTKMVVDFDDRISVGDLDMPGLPTTNGDDNVPFVLTAWRRIAHP